MKELLDIYIRSVGEQEQAGDAPEHYQDLGTFLCWLLERHGYEIHVRAYRREGIVHRKSTGRSQWGVDILASKPDPDGVDRAWRFVLKQGDFGSRQYQPSVDGTMIHDLWLAAGRDPSDDSRHAPNDGDWERVTVVAVHNGELKTEEIGSQVKNQRELIQKQCGVAVEWWDANELVKLAMAPPVDSSQGVLDEHADASLFPPSVRPFARMALDSLQRDSDRKGYTFDLGAIDLLVEHLLPLGRARSTHGRMSMLGKGEPLKPRRLYRAASELALFVGMLEVECRRLASGNSSPVLETISRILCRLVEHIRRLERSDLHGIIAKMEALLDNLAGRYIAQAQRLRARLEPLLDIPYSLALPINGEQIDYPLRTLRLGAYLAMAGLACLERKDENEARAFAQALDRLSISNEGGLLSPITDDQIIELGAIWMLWLRLGMHDEVARSTQQLIQRLAVRQRGNHPMPALRQQARQPMDVSDLRTLVDAYYLGRTSATGFNDSGSTILPLAVTLCMRSGTPVPDELLGWFHPLEPTEKNQHARVVYLQSWQPPDDAADEWYAAEIRFRGITEVYDLTNGAEAMVKAFEQFHGLGLPASSAAAWGFPFIDWLAFCLHRTPPPMSLFLQPDLCRSDNRPTSEHSGKRDQSRPSGSRRDQP